MSKTQFQKQLEKVKAYLDDKGIPSAISGKDVVFEIDGVQYRATSVYSAKRLINAAAAKRLINAAYGRTAQKT